MSRLLAVVLILCTQVLAIFGTGNLVLCVHDDGECAIELVGSECCRAAHAAEREQPRHDADECAAMTAWIADHCTDTPYKQDQTVVAHAAQLRSAMDHDARTVPSAIIAWTAPALLVRAADARLDVRGPPREPVPRRSLSFVLRC